MTIDIRLLSADDAADFRDLRLAALKAHPESLGGDAEAEKAYSLNDWMERLERTHVFGAFDAGKLVGMAGLVLYDGAHMSHSGKLVSLYTAPSHRRQRVARQLLDVIAQAAQERIEQIFASCSTTNAAAKALLEQNGFTSYGTEPRILKIGNTYHDEYLMVRDLRSA